MKKTILKISILSLALSPLFIACDKTSDDPELPTIGGYNSSDEVAAANLAGYWSFDGSTSESVSNLTGTATNTTFTTGKKGQALKGAEGGYVLYENAGTKLNNLGSFSTAFWLNTAQYTDGARAIFQIVDEDGFWPNLHVGLEPYAKDGVGVTDTLRFKMEFQNSTAPAWVNQFIETKIGQSTDKWVHIVTQYDGGTSTYSIYVNGAKIDIGDAANRYGSNPAEGGTGLGNLVFDKAQRIIFGAWKQQLPGNTPDGWMGNYTGMIDEFRVYNKALTDAEVKALFDLETAGR